MFKGFIDYKDSKIPFIIVDYKMELFGEDDMISSFCKDYNFVHDYTLTGTCCDIAERNITIIVEKSIGNTCYLKCFYISMLNKDTNYEVINFESSILDSIFQYKYHYIDNAREGVNISAHEKEIYSIPFSINSESYVLKYYIGHDHRMGLLNSFTMCGRTSIELKHNNIMEFYQLVTLLTRFMQFITSTSDVNYQRIKITKENSLSCAYFYCKELSSEQNHSKESMFMNFDIDRYVPKILDNIALDLSHKVEKSIPLGHIKNYGNFYSSQRFIEQIMAFEYLFQKVHPEKAKNKKFPLKDEIILMLDTFPEILSNRKSTPTEVAERIKELRRKITHGYVYYYDFNNDPTISLDIILLSDLIQRMSLKHIGFSDEDISDFRNKIIAF